MRHRRRTGRLLPEHVDLGLRLTVGEDVIKKPSLPSSQGAGHFPDERDRARKTEHLLPSMNAYYPSFTGNSGMIFFITMNNMHY